ncbi:MULTISPECIES: V-type ATP synthase subunit F [Streptomyces]|uniref:V-type ATP synthase subunit F n=1 Tax=Streptomyces TaxID=1883 RepID=UPI002E11C944|nr:V-type ATP synthase subunit F [Streptomyces murinus]WSI83311.1 V-type ATP synthase subunit F [Streptomyces murinus]
MGTVAAIGARADVTGLALAGVEVRVAEDAETVRRAWRSLPGTVTLVVLTRAAAGALGAETTAPAPNRPLTVVMSS